MSITDQQTHALPPPSPRRTPPGPRGHWLFGVLPEVARDPLGFYERVWRRHGDFVRLRAIPGVFYYLLVHPEAVEHVLAQHHKNYRKPDSFKRPVSRLAGEGLLTDEGPSWLRQRRLAQPAFHRQQLADLDGPVVRATEVTLGRWDRGEDGQVLDILPEMMRLSLSIVSTTLFSADVSQEADEIGRAYREAFAYVGHLMNHPFSPPPWLPTPRNRRFARAKALLDRVVLGLIAERRLGGEARDDLLARLMAARDEETQERLTDRQLRDEVLTLLTAGHETVGAALSWTWYLLAKHPEVQHWLHEEVNALGGRTPITADLPKLRLCRAVFEEAMRLYPPAWGQPRQALAADEIGGYALPAGSQVMVCQYLTHRHPEFWEEPERFQPERFLGEAPADRPPRFAYFPFGGGPRACIGNQFALIEATLVLATVAPRYEMDLVPDHSVVPDPTFTLRPKYGVKVVLRRRG